MKLLTIAVQTTALLAAALGMAGCKVTNPDQEIVISSGSKGSSLAAEPAAEPGIVPAGPPIIISDDVVQEDVQPKPAPVPAPEPLPIPEPSGPRAKALANCQGYFPAGATLLADGTVELTYSSIAVGVVYPRIIGGLTHDTQSLWLLDLGNGRADYFLGNCLELMG